MAKTMFTRLDVIVAVTRAKKPAVTKRYRVSRIDESYCYVDATSPEEAIDLSGDGNVDGIRWNVWIGETEAKLDE